MARPQQRELEFDFSGITDETFWEKAEERIYTALQSYAEQAENGHGYQRRLFADDAARGFAFIDLCRKRYDVMLMNPPFGDFSENTATLAEHHYPATKNDVYGAFIERTMVLSTVDGRIGAITPRTWLSLTRFEGLREIVIEKLRLDYLIDLGYGVLESMAEVSLAVISPLRSFQATAFLGAFSSEDKPADVRKFTDELTNDR